MKKTLKKVIALALSSATAFSVFAVSASAAQYVNTHSNSYWGSYWCGYCHDYHTLGEDDYWNHYDWYYNDGYYDGYYYGDSYVQLTANQWDGGEISVKVPSGAKVVKCTWSNTENVTYATPYSLNKITSATIEDPGDYRATCTVDFQYTISPGKVVTESVSVTISGTAYKNANEAAEHPDYQKVETSYGSYYPGYPGYWPDYDYDNGFWYNGVWYSYSDGYYWNGKWYPYYPGSGSTSIRKEYTVDWSTDTFYYNGKKQVPTATVTVGSRTIELNVKLTSGNGIDVGKHRVVASVPSGYSGIKLDGASLYYNIEEPLKSGFVYEDGYTYYYEGGKAVTGWQTIDGDTYYFEKDGKATKGWKWIDGKAWYYFGSDGKMQTGWVRDGGKIYYCYDSGVMAKSTWLKLDGYWYYFYNDGRMAESEWVYSGGKWYFLAGDGRMATNTTIPGGYYVDSTGAWVK